MSADDVDQVRQIAAVNAGLYRSAEADPHALRNHIAQAIEAECDHDPNPEKYDVCEACASAARIARHFHTTPANDLPSDDEGERR